MRKPCCEKEGINKGAWSKQEDQRLIDYIKAHGEGCWRSLPKAAGLQRCGKSCRLRWINYLRPDIKRGNFAQDEEDLIIKLHALLGNRWSLIAGRLPGRTDNEVKNYWNSHIRKKLVRMGIDPNNHKPHQHLLNPLIISTNQNVNNNNKTTTTTTATPNQNNHQLRPVTAPSHGSHQITADADADNFSSSSADSMDNNIAATSRPPAAASSFQADLNLNLTINSMPTSSPRSLVLLDKEDRLLGAGNYLQNKIITNYEYPSNKVVVSSTSAFDVEVDSSPTLLLFR